MILFLAKSAQNDPMTSDHFGRFALVGASTDQQAGHQRCSRDIKLTTKGLELYGIRIEQCQMSNWGLLLFLP